MKKKVLVMGGSYFIGKKIVNSLLNNNYLVYTLNRGTHENHDKRIINLKCDRNNIDEMKVVLSGYFFNIVVDVSALDRKQVEIFYECLNKKELEKFVFISSSAVYDVQNFDIPYSEETSLKENKYWSEYGSNKIEAENFLIGKFKVASKNLIILRPPYVYGENNYAQRESFMFEHILNDKPIIMPNDGSMYIQFIYAGDLANIVVKLLEARLEAISIFNVGNKKPVTVREWIEFCAKAANKKAKLIEYDYKKYNRDEREFFPFYDYDNVLDVTKVNKIYDKETGFSEGLRMALEWYINNMDNIIFKENVEINEKIILKELGYI